MKSGHRISVIALAILLAMVLSARGQFSLTSVASTNTFTVHYGTGNDDWPNIYGTNPIPLIIFSNVPVTVALENLARQGHINYLLDPQINYARDASGMKLSEPFVNVRWENTTAGRAFCAVCLTAGFAIDTDTNTGMAFVRNKGHEVSCAKMDISGDNTNIIPLTQFEDVPLSIALQNLVRQGGIKCILSPQIGSGGQDNPEPVVSLRWENLTAEQSLAAVCENYDLAITKYPVSGIIRIGPKDE